MFPNLFNMGSLEEKANHLEQTTESNTVTAERLLSTTNSILKPAAGLLDKPPLSYVPDTDVLVYLFSVSKKCIYNHQTYKPRKKIWISILSDTRVSKTDYPRTRR